MQWIWSQVEYLSIYCAQWDKAIANDMEDKKNIDIHLKKLREPFAFLENYDEVQRFTSNEDDDGNEMIDYKHPKEEQLHVQLDMVAQGLAKKIGFDHVPWYSLTQLALTIYMTLTLLICFARPDFLNLTICVAAFQMFMNPEKFKKGHFRIVVAATGISFFYDLFWLLVISDVST